MIDPKIEGRIQRLLDQSEIFDLVRIVPNLCYRPENYEGICW